MHVMPHSPLSAIDVQDAADTPAAASIQQASGASPSIHRISPQLLDRATGFYRTLNVLNCDTQDALTILFDVLNTGSDAGYQAALRAANDTGNIPGASPARVTPSQMRSPAASSLHTPEKRPQLWAQRSWPEKVMALKDNGAHATLRIGMMEEFFRQGSGPNHRGHENLPAGCLAFFPLERGDRIDFKKKFYADQVDPILRSLQPNQAALFAIPGGGTLLQGRDEHGDMFGFSSGLGSTPTRHTDVLRDRALVNASDMFRLLPSGPVPWAILIPRELKVDTR
jgi:hypothetical protein